MQHDCISWAGLGSLKAWLFCENGMEGMLPMRVRLTATSVSRVVAAAGLRERSLKLVLCECEAAPTPVSLVRASNRRVPLKLRASLDFAAPRLAQRLGTVEQMM